MSSHFERPRYPHLLSLSIAVFCLLIPAGAVTAGEVTLGTDPAGAAGTAIDLSLPLGATEGELLLFLGEAEAKAASGIRLDVHFTAGIEAQAELVDAATGEVRSTFDLPAGRPLRLLLRLRELAPLAQVKGWIALTRDSRTSHHPFKVQRAAALELTVLDAADKKIALPVGGSELSRALQIENPSPTASTVLSVFVGPLARTDGRPIRGATLECRSCEEAVLGPGEVRTVELAGSGFEEGSYRASLRLVQPGHSDKLELALTRGAPLENLDVGGEVTVAATRYPACVLIAFPHVVCPFESWAQVELTVSETLGVATEIFPPHVPTLRRAGDDVEWGIGGRRLRLSERDDAGKLHPVDSFDSELPARASRTFVVGIGDLEPGSYSGEIRVAGPDSTAAKKTLTLKVRDHALVPFLVILLGVVGSWYVHGWARGRRQRAVHHARIAGEREAVQNRYSKPPDDPVWEHLLAELGKLDGRVRLEKDLTAAAVAETLKDLETRRKLYLQVRANEDKVRTLLAAFPVEPPELLAQKQGFERELTDLGREARTALQLPEGEGIAQNEAGGAPEEIEALVGLFEGIRTAAVQAPATAMKERLGELIDEDLEPGLVDGAEGLVVELDEITGELGTSGASPELVRRLGEVRQKYAALRVDELELRRQLLADELAGLSPQDEEDRHAHKEAGEALAEVEMSLDRAAAAVAAVDAVLAELEKGRRQHLRALIEHQALLAGAAGKPQEVAEDLWRKRLERAREQIANARSRWKKGEWEAAERAYGRARDEYFKGRSEILADEVEAIEDLWRDAAGELAAIGEKSERSTREEALKAEFRPRLGTLRGAIREAAAGDDPEAGFLAARRELLRGRLEELEEMRTEFVSKLQPAKAAVSNPAWDDVVEPLLGDLDETLNSARKTHPEELAAAERGGYRAQSLARMLVDRWRSTRTASRAKMNLKEVLDQVAEQMVAAAGVLGAPGAAAPGLTVPGAPDPAAGDAPGYRDPGVISASDWLERIERRDLAVLIVVLVIAAVSGLYLLWADDPTFGNAGDYLKALLWGFGLHEAGKGVLEILAGAGAVAAEETAET